MLQSRSGRCPYCSFENEADAVACAECGAPLSWADTSSGPRRARPEPLFQIETGEKPARLTRAKKKPRQTIVSRGLLKLMAIFVVLCAATVVAVSYHFGIDLPFLPAHEEAIDVNANHGASVQDAETFRLLTINGARAPQNDESYAPEGQYIISYNMPHGSDTLELTLSSAWNLLDYSTRLQYANNIAKRWQKLHAPYRALFTLYDLSGKEIGGRTPTGSVWVQMEQTTAFDVPALLAKDINGVQAAMGAPQSEATPAPSTNNTAEGWKSWQRDSKSLVAFYRSGGLVSGIYVAADDPTRKASDKSRLLDIGNLQKSSLAYRVVFMHSTEAPRRYAGVKAIVNPWGGKLPNNPGPDSASHTVTYRAGGQARSASIFYINADGKTVRAEGVNLPWQKTVSVTGAPALWLAADNEWLAQGDITTEILVDGKSVATGSGQDAVAVADLTKTATPTATAQP